MGCHTIIGVDRVKDRIDLAKELGATHTIDTTDLGLDLVEKVRGFTESRGSTITIDTTGVVALIKDGLEFTGRVCQAELNKEEISLT